MTYLRTLLAVVSLTALQSCAHTSDKARTAIERGQHFYAKGLYSDASIQFQRALQQKSDSAEAYLWLGKADERLGHDGEALAALRRASELMPSADAPRIELANFMLVAYLASPNRPAALYRDISSSAEELLRKNANSFDGLRLKGYLAMADKKPSAATDYFERANRIRADQPDVITALVESLALDGQKKKADETGLAFLKRKPDYGPLYTILYQQNMQDGRQAEAEEILKSKVSHNPRESLYRIELARHYARTGKNQAMIEVLTQILADPKDFPNGRLDVGDFYIESRNLAEARNQYTQGLQTSPQARMVYLKRLARTDLAMNDRAAAERDLEAVLKEQPRDIEARASLAALRMSANDPAEKLAAAKEFRSLVGESPDNVGFRVQYAASLRAAGDKEGAKEQYRQILRRQPGNLPALRAMADLSIQQERIDDALAFSGRILAMDPNNIDALLVRSAALATKREFRETRSILTRLTVEHPQLREAQLQLALLDVEEHHYTEAESRFRRYYVPGTGDVRPLEGIVEVYRAQNQLDKAVALLKEEIRKAPQADPLRALLARTAMEAGQNDLAVQEYQQLYRTHADSPVFVLQLGLAYQAQGNTAAAISQFENAARLAPENALVQAYLGKALEDAGRDSEALKSYRRSLSLDNRNPWVMNNAAYLIAETGGDLNEAQTLATQAVHTDPSNGSFNDTLGIVYMKRRDFASAIHIFESIRNKSPRDVTYRIHLGQALLEAGNRDLSRTELKAALGLPCTQQERDKISRLLKETA